MKLQTVLCIQRIYCSETFEFRREYIILYYFCDGALGKVPFLFLLFLVWVIDSDICVVV